MPYAITPLVGMKIGEVNAPFTPKIGTVITADDGHDYIFAKASGAIAGSAVCILTEPAMTMATGAGAWTNGTTALVANDLAWFKKTAI